MRNATRLLFNAFVSQIALLNSVASATEKFTVAPVVEQKLEERIQEGSEFLSRINTVPVDQQEGDKVGVGVTRPLASRTNTAAGNRRTPTDPTDTSDLGRYRCEKTDFDHAIKYAKLDGGLTADPVKAIYVADVADAAKRDYVTLDALVHDATELLDEWNRDDTDLVVIVGRNLLQDKYANIINTAGDKATEMEARDRILTLPKQIGGKRAIVVPFFPANSLLITRLDNLSIYVQNGSRRRLVKDEPELDQIANYESVNEAYVVEDYGMCALVENIVMGVKPA